MERQRLTTTPVFARFLPRSVESTAADGPAFLIATSAGEVGVDLDADHMVCDLVSWERMVQRLGRVNRRAEPGRSEIEVIPARFDPKDEEADTRIEDKEVDPRLAVLTAVVALLPAFEGDSDAHDASPGEILRLRADPASAKVLAAATSNEPLRPALTPAVVEAWAMTSLEHHPGRPNVAPWIRGWVEETPQARVLWRRVFPLPKSFVSLTPRVRSGLNDYFSAPPPHLTETLEAPASKVAELIVGLSQQWANQDITTEDTKSGSADHEAIVIVLDSENKVEALLHPEKMRRVKSKPERDALIREITGRTLVIDARLGGLDDDGLLSAMEASPAPTIDADDGTWPFALEQTAGFRVRRVAVDAEGRQSADQVERSGADGLCASSFAGPSETGTQVPR